MINARGKVPIPGLRYMHRHPPDRWNWSSLLNVANGLTGVRDPSAVRATRDIVELRRAVERGRTLKTRFVASDTFTHGLPKSRATSVAVDSSQEMRAEIQQRTRTALAFIWVDIRHSRNVFLAAADESKRFGIPLTGHVPPAITAVEASDAGVREYGTRLPASHALCNGRRRDQTTSARPHGRQTDTRRPPRDDQRCTAVEDSTCVLKFSVDNAGKCRQMAEHCSRNGTWFVPTLVEK